MSTHAYTGTAASPSAYRNTLLADRARLDAFHICMEHAAAAVPTCAGCDAVDVPLELNHIFRTTWVQRRLSRYRRMLRMRAEAAAGLLDLRCRSCNMSYRPVTAHAYSPDDPF